MVVLHEAGTHAGDKCQHGKYEAYYCDRDADCDTISRDPLKSSVNSPRDLLVGGGVHCAGLHLETCSIVKRKLKLVTKE